MIQGWENVSAEFITFVTGDRTYAWHAPEFVALLPPPARLTIDVGCGEGRFTRLLRERGHRVIAIDAAPTLVQAARDADPEGDYRLADAAALPVADGAADLVVSFMALQDVDDAPGAISEASRVLGPGGRLCVALLHPAWTSGEVEGEGDAAELVVRGSYLARRPMEILLGPARVEQFHRPLEWYSRALEEAGFLLESLREHATRRQAPGRIPLFLHLRALKP